MAIEGHNHRWLRKWLRGEPHFVIYQDGEPYLYRRFVVPRNRFFNIYLHKFVKSDYDEALHDHPWWFMSVILKGAYWEHRADRRESARSRRTAGSIAIRSAKTAHRVELERDEEWIDPADMPDADGWYPLHFTEKPVWTLFLTGPKIRDWGFHCPKGWMPWQEFTDGPHGSVRKGCGEFS